MDDNVVATGLVALLGVVLGFGLTEAKAFLERRRRKTGIAGLLLIELKELMVFVNKELAIADDGGFQEMFAPLPTPIFDAHCGELVSLFDPELADGVVLFYGRVSALNEQGVELRRAISDRGSVERQKRLHDQTSPALGGVASGEREFLREELSAANHEVLELISMSKTFAYQVRTAAEAIESTLKKIAPNHAGEQVDKLRAMSHDGE